MRRILSIAAFGALNTDSYRVFDSWIQKFAKQYYVTATLKCAGPYPNAEGKSIPGRPLRAEALKDDNLRKQLCEAVAADARALGKIDMRCMPCMSMIGFHDGIELALGLPIVRLEDALVEFYWNVPQVGVIHMRPAAARVAEMFGRKAVTPDEAQAAKLLAAEEQTKAERNAGPVESVMKEITEAWRDKGIKHVLFARADAPLARKHIGPIKGVKTDTYFNILAETVIKQAVSERE
ncbi:MAG TPA: hypothetical protein VL625_01000 [Patescibacteria group bacterium]|nr:hypothetical protein [Patescibacteria group bacterium]